MHKNFDPSAANFVNYFRPAFCTKISLKINYFLFILYIAIYYWIVYNNRRRQQREFAESKNFWKTRRATFYIIRAEQRQPLRLKNIFQKFSKKCLMDGEPSTRGNKNFPLTNSQRCAIIRVSKARGSRQGLWKSENAGAFIILYTRKQRPKIFSEKFKKPLDKFPNLWYNKGKLRGKRKFSKRGICT